MITGVAANYGGKVSIGETGAPPFPAPMQGGVSSIGLKRKGRSFADAHLSLIIWPPFPHHRHYINPRLPRSSLLSRQSTHLFFHRILESRKFHINTTYNIQHLGSYYCTGTGGGVGHYERSIGSIACRETWTNKTHVKAGRQLMAE